MKSPYMSVYGRKLFFPAPAGGEASIAMKDAMVRASCGSGLDAEYVSWKNAPWDRVRAGIDRCEIGME